MARSAWQPFDPVRIPELRDMKGDVGNTVVVLSTPKATREGWAMVATVALADGLDAEGHDVIVVDADLDQPSLHLLMEADNAEGVVDLVEFGASKRRVLRKAPNGRLRYMSAGTFAIDPAEVLASAIWQRFCENAAAEGATLVIFSETGAPGVRRLLDLATDLVVLADEDDPVDGAVLGYSDLVRAVCGPAGADEEVPEATAPDQVVVAGNDGEEAEGARATGEETKEQTGPEPGEILGQQLEATAEPEDERASGQEVEEMPEPAAESDEGSISSAKPRSGPRRRVVLVVPLLAAVAFAAWWFGIISLPGTASRDSSQADGEPAPTDVADAPSPGAQSTAPAQDTQDPEAGDRSPNLGTADPVSNRPIQGSDLIPPGPSATFANLAEVSGRLTYIVQIGSYSVLSEATQKAGELWTSNRVGAIVAPVQVRGESFYRVLIGPVPDSAAAVEETQRVAGDKSSWLFRYARFAFHLGETDDPARALARERELVAMGVPVYTIVVEHEDGSLAYRLYGGAYRNDEEAEGFRSVLTRVGIEGAPLIPITGLPRLP